MRRSNQRKQEIEAYQAFESFIEKVEANQDLPYTTVRNLPGALKRETRNRVGTLDYEISLKIIQEAISEIEHGSTVSLDKLIQKRLPKV